MKMRSRLAVLALVVACAAPAVAQDESAGTAEILATIGSFNVTPRYVDYVIRQHFAREIMEDIVRSRVIADEAKAQGIRVGHGHVTEALDRERTEFATEEDFQAHLRAMGFSLKGYREHVHTELLLGALLDKAAEVTDADAEAYYTAHKSEFSAETELHVLDIAAANQQDALVAFRAVLDGTPFEVAARRFSADPAEPGGDLGWVTRDTIPTPDLWDVALALQVGDTSEPFPLGGKYHVIRVAGRRSAETTAFEAAKEEIKLRLRQQSGVSEADYVTSLIAKANVRVAWAPVTYLDEEYRALKGIRVAVDGRTLHSAAAPFISDQGVMMVPAKVVLRAAGAAITWRPGAKMMEIKRGAITASVSLGERVAVVNREVVDMKAPALLKDGTLYIPPRTILTGLGLAVHWNPLTKLLSVSSVASD